MVICFVVDVDHRCVTCAPAIPVFFILVLCPAWLMPSQFQIDNAEYALNINIYIYITGCLSCFWFKQLSHISAFPCWLVASLIFCADWWLHLRQHLFCRPLSAKSTIANFLALSLVSFVQCYNCDGRLNTTSYIYSSIFDHARLLLRRWQKVKSLNRCYSPVSISSANVSFRDRVSCFNFTFIMYSYILSKVIYSAFSSLYFSFSTSTSYHLSRLSTFRHNTMLFRQFVFISWTHLANAFKKMWHFYHSSGTDARKATNSGSNKSFKSGGSTIGSDLK